jgi:hypothetical protein
MPALHNLLFAAAIVACVCLFGLYIYCLRFIFQFSIEGDKVIVSLFGVVPVRRVLIADIEKAEVISWKNLLPGYALKREYLFGERWPGYVTGRGLAIKKRTGLSRFIVITPEDPERMLHVINEERRRTASLS